MADPGEAHSVPEDVAEVPEAVPIPGAPAQQQRPLIVAAALFGFIGIALGIGLGAGKKTAPPEVGTLAFDQQAVCVLVGHLEGTDWDGDFSLYETALWNHQSLTPYHQIFRDTDPDGLWARTTADLKLSEGQRRDEPLTARLVPLRELCETAGLAESELTPGDIGCAYVDYAQNALPADLDEITGDMRDVQRIALINNLLASDYVTGDQVEQDEPISQFPAGRLLEAVSKFDSDLLFDEALPDAAEYCSER